MRIVVFPGGPEEEDEDCFQEHRRRKIPEGFVWAFWVLL